MKVCKTVQRQKGQLGQVHTKLEPDYFIFKILKIRWTAHSLRPANADQFAIALPPVAPAPTAIMSHHTPTLTFWADKQQRWVARARGFNLATATSAFTLLSTSVRQQARFQMSKWPSPKGRTVSLRGRPRLSRYYGRGAKTSASSTTSAGHRLPLRQ